METKKLRGQSIMIDRDIKEVFVKIQKPLDGMFSLSDKICEYLDIGYSVVVMLPRHTMIVTAKTPVVRTEIVKSKFAGSSNWSRNWYRIEVV